MAINDNNIKIRDKVFKGDLGAESKYQNEAILALMKRQDAIIESMNQTQRAKYEELRKPNKVFFEEVRKKTIDVYNQIRKITGKEPIKQEENKDENNKI